LKYVETSKFSLICDIKGFPNLMAFKNEVDFY
jgi:hypothetical protein